MFNLLAQSTYQAPATPVQLGLFAGISLVWVIFLIVNFVFWVLSLIHLFRHENVPNRIMWITLVIIVPLADFVYFFGPRRKYNKGGGMPSMQPQVSTGSNMSSTAPVPPTAPVSPNLPPSPPSTPPVTPQPPAPSKDQGQTYNL